MTVPVLTGLLFAGCRAARVNAEPSITFTRLPEAGEGGPDKVDTIEGRVTGARPGQQIVLFARSGVWWVQPLANQPFTNIQPDSRWSNATHLGTQYAALLVQPGYRPPTTLSALPKKGGAVVAVATTQGIEPAAAAAGMVRFSGYEWEIRRLGSDRGGTRNLYDPANAWTDGQGLLHLRIARRSGQTTCAEVKLAQSLGYGSYRFVLRDVSHLEPAAVLSIFTWDEFAGELNNRELDIEISRWGDPVSKNAQYVVQPYYVPANVIRFEAPPGTLTHSFRWEPGRVSFQTLRGPAVVKEHVFTSGVPSPGSESLHLNLYVFGNTRTTLEKDAEVVIEKFEYLP